MQKIAVVISGHPRTFLKTEQSFKKNCKFNYEHQIDFFLHFYNSEDNENILNVFKPKDWVCEMEYLTNFKYLDLSFSNPEFINKDNYKYNTYSQFKNNLLAFSLIPKGIYSTVIKSRYDLLLNQEFDFSTLDMNKINIPAGEDFGGINDRLCISSYNNMEYYFNFYKYMHLINKSGVKFHPESLLKEYLEKSGIQIERFLCNTNHILR